LVDLFTDIWEHNTLLKSSDKYNSIILRFVSDQCNNMQQLKRLLDKYKLQFGSTTFVTIYVDHFQHPICTLSTPIITFLHNNRQRITMYCHNQIAFMNNLQEIIEMWCENAEARYGIFNVTHD